MTDWTPERIERLRALWAEGKPASAIAVALGGFDHCGDGGRSAVMGKVHRLNLTGRAEHKPPRPKAPRRPSMRGNRRSNTGGIGIKLANGTFGKKTFAVVKEPEPAPIPYAGPRYGILDDRLGHLMCRAIVEGSGAGTIFCSAPTESNSPFRFCPDHAAVYLTKPRSRLRRRGIAA